MTDRATPTPTDDAALWTRDEITRLVSESGDAAETLSNLVRLIQERFGTDVCSVYLLEPDRSTLVLAATIGLRPESVGKIRMRLAEGLVGLVGEQMQPQVIEHATTHPRRLSRRRSFPSRSIHLGHGRRGTPSQRTRLPSMRTTSPQ